MNPKASKGPKMKRNSDAVVGFARIVAEKKKKKQQQAAGGSGSGGGGDGGGGGGGGGGLEGKTGIARIAPPGTEVLLVVAPKQAELMVRACDRAPLLRIH